MQSKKKKKTKKMTGGYRKTSTKKNKTKKTKKTKKPEEEDKRQKLPSPIPKPMIPNPYTITHIAMCPLFHMHPSPDWESQGVYTYSQIRNPKSAVPKKSRGRPLDMCMFFVWLPRFLYLVAIAGWRDREWI